MPLSFPSKSHRASHMPTGNKVTVGVAIKSHKTEKYDIKTPNCEKKKPKRNHEAYYKLKKLVYDCMPTSGVTDRGWVKTTPKGP